MLINTEITGLNPIPGVFLKKRQEGANFDQSWIFKYFKVYVSSLDF
jgi:hypothetical protein